MRTGPFVVVAFTPTEAAALERYLSRGVLASPDSAAVRRAYRRLRDARLRSPEPR